MSDATSISSSDSSNDSITKDPTSLPRHQRLRYWNSYEECVLIEMWNRYKKQVLTVDQNAPVFRYITDDMRKKGLTVTPQEVRRKMATLKRRYETERKMMKADGKNELDSKWRLYPMMNCIYEDEFQNSDPYHEERVVVEALSELVVKNGFKNNTLVATKEPTLFDLPVYRSSYSLVHDPNIDLGENRSPNGQEKDADADADMRLLRKQFTPKALEQLRLENQHLREQRDADLKILRMEEQELTIMESFLLKWAEEEEAMLKGIEMWQRQSKPSGTAI